MLDKPVEVTKGVTEVLAIVYFSPEQVEEREGVHYSLESGHQVEWQKEENWMFRLSRHKPAILDWLRNIQPIQPKQFTPQASF